ncbi:allantoate amidohydrolase [Falsiroseomonas selenitidurans]|uniref:Allantoate amidohydrolase n=1 Tax=Falsiroseomonas selenitidurans TaxID=2716335 RepID=A0ABX1E6V8_9PROT|nr:allantoate amidohydrolase [Falsiroseomonas selenitidurans]NKC31538.1 allantoate amidohydrolase [Falsiroseomonas selenitidurans]
MSVASNFRPSGARLWDSLMEFSRIGATAKGGNNRQTLTELDGEARALLQRQAEAAGALLSLDRLGNMALTRPGRDPSRRPVAIGSHLDTQPTGGKFDGVLGVLAGLEILRALDEAGIETEAPVMLINWTNEEGARFSPPMMGSGGAMGIFPEPEVLAKTDSAGAAFGAELARIGWAGSADPAALQGLEAYFELHIEQGPVLERLGLDLGIVTHALAQHWFEVVVTGEEAHGGSSMAGRRDAMMGAAEMMLAIEAAALAAGARATVGRATLHPDSRNVVPGRVWFSLDTRHDDEHKLAALAATLRAEAASIGARRGLSIAVEDFWISPATLFATPLVTRLREAAVARGIAFQEMPTAIGHDAVYCARRVPSVMLFCPCHGGISHNEAESITPAWAEAGLLVMADAVLATAGVARG